MLDHVEELEKHFIAGQRNYRLGLEGYRRSLENYKLARRHYDPESSVHKNIVGAYRDGMEAYANGVNASRRKVEQQRMLRNRVDRLKILLKSHGSLGQSDSALEHLRDELQHATGKYVEFLRPKIYTNGGTRVAPSHSSTDSRLKTKQSIGRSAIVRGYPKAGSVRIGPVVDESTSQPRPSEISPVSTSLHRHVRRKRFGKIGESRASLIFRR